MIDPVTGLGSLPPNKQPPDMHGPSERVVPPVQCRTEVGVEVVVGLGIGVGSAGTGRGRGSGWGWGWS